MLRGRRDPAKVAWGSAQGGLSFLPGGAAFRAARSGPGRAAFPARH